MSIDEPPSESIRLLLPSLPLLAVQSYLASLAGCVPFRGATSFSVDGEIGSLCFTAAARLQNTTSTPLLELIAPQVGIFRAWLGVL